MNQVSFSASRSFCTSRARAIRCSPHLSQPAPRAFLGSSTLATGTDMMRRPRTGSRFVAHCMRDEICQDGAELPGIKGE